MAVVDGLGTAARGQRFDRDLAVYQYVWKGERVFRLADIVL